MIEIITTKQIDEKAQWVFITLIAGGYNVEHTTVQPFNTNDPILSGPELLEWCNTQEDRYKLEILKDMYPGAKIKKETLEAMEDWIAEGAENLDKNGKKIKIKKIIPTKEHPKKIKTLLKIEEADISNELKTILTEILING